MDDNQPLVDKINNKDKGLTILLLQTLNGLDLEQNGTTLREITNSSIKYEIDILCLTETNTN